MAGHDGVIWLFTKILRCFFIDARYRRIRWAIITDAITMQAFAQTPLSWPDAARHFSISKRDSNPRVSPASLMASFILRE